MIYELGHIYVIWDIENHNLTYYGSTCNLNSRMKQHKNKTTTCSSSQIIERGNYEVAILETYENIDKYDLAERERWYIENKPCVNKRIPNRTKAETKEKQSEYYQNNKEKIAKYYQNNKDKMNAYSKEYSKDYYVNNKEKITERNHVNYLKNKEKLKQKFVCDCGGKYTLLGKAQHKKSKKHQKYIIANQRH
tara:strand:- start:131 stop:706 length:576 start_codon:yes stop_codon:yes gene_type:complete